MSQLALQCRSSGYSLAMVFSAREQESPFPSGSTLSCNTRPSSTSMEYLFDLRPPSTARSWSRPTALVNSPFVSASMRTYGEGGQVVSVEDL